MMISVKPKFSKASSKINDHDKGPHSVWLPDCESGPAVVRLPGLSKGREVQNGAKEVTISSLDKQPASHFTSASTSPEHPTPSLDYPSSSSTHHLSVDQSSAEPVQDVNGFHQDEVVSRSQETAPCLHPGMKQARLRYKAERAARAAKNAQKTYEGSLQDANMSSESPSATRKSSGPSTSSSGSGSTSNELAVTQQTGHRIPIVNLPKPAPAQPRGRHNQSGSEWSTWLEVRVKVFGLPANITTCMLYQEFSKEGTVSRIELYEDYGVRNGNALIAFSPPPVKPFWIGGKYAIMTSRGFQKRVRLQLELRSRTSVQPSSVDPQRRHPELMKLNAESLDFGIMIEPTSMMKMYEILPKKEVLGPPPALAKPEIKIQLRQNMLRRELEIEFPLPVHAAPQVDELFKFQIPFSHLEMISMPNAEGEKLVLVISMETPPKFFKKLDAIHTHEDKARVWHGNDAWYRQTDVVYQPNTLKKFAVSLKKIKAIVDLGRWTIYRFVFDMTKNSHSEFESMRQALRDYNIEIVSFPKFTIIPRRNPMIWKYVNKFVSGRAKTSGFLDELTEDIATPLIFAVQYQLEVCISQGYLSEYNLTPEFVTKLKAMNDVQAQAMLEFVANQRQRVFEPMSLFDTIVPNDATIQAKIPKYCALSRSATVTPTTLLLHTPTVETSNRVIRHYFAYSDRFLRVRFTDEKSEGKTRINASQNDIMNEVFTRVKRAMTNGIVIGERRYEFLAFGNSQFREHGAYFFAPTSTLTPGVIRRWMGMFEDIKVVAKYAARLGQCFSTTRAIHGPQITLDEIPDIEVGKYNFTDGVGKISLFLAQLVAVELGINHTSAEPPSAFQFRLGGCKGVLAVAQDIAPREIHIRHSQYKFPAAHEGLEIIRWAQYASANLNRQLILVLSALGVPDQIFVQKLVLQLSDLEQAMTDQKMALRILQKDVDQNQMTLKLASMILDGFQTSGEPFITSLLQLWRAWAIKYLKEKARITISEGSLLLGCIDETASLRGHYDSDFKPSVTASVDEKAKHVPQVFVQLSRDPNINNSDSKSNVRPKVILGPMLLARNPSLHPGDIRVVCGVDVPALRHLKDVVVLPQTGDRDIASMCSGGDLDGDDFLVIWDKDLLPREWNHPPMDYTPKRPVEHEGGITNDDITSFFVTYMKNDTLGAIATAHVAQADWLENGVKEDKCLRLAGLHSDAVDFVKTGLPARLSQDLKPQKWPHFMEKDHLPKEKIYISKKVLGRLYDQVERVDFVPAFTAPFDKRILKAYNLDHEILDDAREAKQDYDTAVRRIMAQHNIKSEFEVWSTFVLQHADSHSDFKFHEVIGELSQALKDQHREICYRKAGGKNSERMNLFVAAMYQVTAEETATAVREYNELEIVEDQSKPLRRMTTANMPLISFPWLFQDVLGKIANDNTHDPDTILINTSIPGKAILDSTTASHATRPRKGRISTSVLNDSDDLQTAQGTTHYGDLLELFGDSGKSDAEKEVHKRGSAITLLASANESALPSFTSIGGASLIEEMLLDASSLNPAELTASQPRVLADETSDSNIDALIDISATSNQSASNMVLDNGELKKQKGFISPEAGFGGDGQLLPGLNNNLECVVGKRETDIGEKTSVLELSDSSKTSDKNSDSGRSSHMFDLEESSRRLSFAAKADRPSQILEDTPLHLAAGLEGLQKGEQRRGAEQAKESDVDQQNKNQVGVCCQNTGNDYPDSGHGDDEISEGGSDEDVTVHIETKMSIFDRLANFNGRK